MGMRGGARSRTSAEKKKKAKEIACLSPSSLNSLLKEKTSKQKRKEKKKLSHHAPDRVHQVARDPQRCDGRGQGAQGPRQGPARYDWRKRMSKEVSARVSGGSDGGGPIARASKERTRAASPLVSLFVVSAGSASSNCGSRASLLYAVVATLALSIGFGFESPDQSGETKRRRRPITKESKKRNSPLFFFFSSFLQRPKQAR